MATKLNLIIDKNCSYAQEIELLDDNDDPLNTEGMVANASFRKSHTSSNVVVFDCALSNGSLVLSLDVETLDNIMPGRYIWDTILQDGSTVNKTVEGILTIKATSSEPDEDEL